MFYSQFILAKKGPLGTIWIAAHLERKLRKNQVADTDIGVSVDSILSPDVPIALRLSSHLLLGVVRIYNKKVNYLFDDCSEALLKVKQAFRSTAVDLPPEESKAPYHSITLPETFDLDDFELPDTELFQGNFVDHHVSTKEQITLQDTMDGVVYSTSQFGFDERFGDGDASQIGLDLDEELLLNKGTSSGHGVLLNSCVDSKISFESSSAQKGERLDEEMHEASEAIPTNCSIEAPSTPGLVEGPNLPSNQDALICDDYTEEDHNPIQLAAQDIVVTASTNAEDSIDQDVLQDNICDLSNQKIEKLSSQVGSPSITEPIVLINTSNTAHISGSNQVFKTSESLDAECAQNETCGKIETDGALAVSGEAPDIGLDEAIVSSKGSYKTPSHSGQPDHCHEKPSASGFFSVSESPNFVDKSFIEPVIDAEGKHHIDSIFEKEAAQDFIRPEASEMSDVNARVDILHGSKSILQPCNLHSNDENADLDNSMSLQNLPSKEFGVVSELMSGQDATNVFNAKEQDITDLNLNEVQLSNAALHNKLYGPSDISKNVVLPEINDSTVSELPSPEKMLSLPDVPISQSNELFVGTTPEREVLVQEDQNATVNNNISGRKRSFTESTMTLQSLKSVESSEATQSKRTVDFVPDDDDLLSSILVGRRSTVLKVKSTPPAIELTSSKRPRITPRSNANKRKVLVDDSMVLHGDIIRQQLLNTEDIRRVRKKAPSTHPEIWILQKHFLESEIFIEPIFTGMSAELTSLHCQPFDLRETKLVQDEESKEQCVAVDIIGSPINPKVGEETAFEGTNVQLVAEDENARQPAVCTSVESDMKDSSDNGGNALQNERTSDGEVGHAPSLDASETRTEMDTECRREPELVSDEAVLLTSAQPNCSLPVNDVSITAENRILADRSADEHGTVNKAEIPESDIRYDDRGLPLDHEREDLDIGSSKPVGGELSTQNPEHQTVYKSELPESDLKYDDSVLLLDHEREDLKTVGGDLDIDNAEHVTVNNAEFLEFDLQIHERNLLDHEREDSESTNPVREDLGTENALFLKTVNQEDQFVETQIFMDATAIASDYPTHENLNDLEAEAEAEADVLEHDTDFLNFDDDDEIAQEDDNSMPNAEGPQILDNSGWSTRTRAVANYLQVLFQKEAQHGRTGLQLDNILAKKSRKEASRMFFETLVLKTRDYIHVEQPGPFGNIGIKPRARLLKSDF
ncbi:hypothetical protein V2J09_023688 [Rumex salicifolius]